MDRDCLSAFRCVSSVLTRRTFLRGSALTALALASGMTPRGAAGLAPAAIPFPLGVASGDPTYDSVVLWTRLAVDPLNGGGMPPIPHSSRVENRHRPQPATRRATRYTSGGPRRRPFGARGSEWTRGRSLVLVPV